MTDFSARLRVKYDDRCNELEDKGVFHRSYNAQRADSMYIVDLQRG